MSVVLRKINVLLRDLYCFLPARHLTLKLVFAGDTGLVMEKFHSEEYQRTFQYLTQFATNSNLDEFSFTHNPADFNSNPITSRDAFRMLQEILQ